MVRFGLFHDIIKAPWMDVSVAFWQKYPNPHSTHVLSEDVLHRYVDEAKRLHTRRLLKKLSKKPKWMNRFIGEAPVYIVEESILDPATMTFTTYTKNVTLNSYMTVEEKCTYDVAASNAEWTARSTEVRVTSSLFSVGNLVEKFGIDRFKTHSEQAKQALYFVLERMRTNTATRTLDSLRKIHDNISVRTTAQRDN